VSDSNGSRVVGAKVAVHQMSRDFPLGSAISKTILGNKPYQVPKKINSENNFVDN
jgi:hypothetical protein